MEEREVADMQIAARRRALVAELRSGRREQARGRLALTSGGFCCLGVACEVSIRQGLQLSKAVALDSVGDECDFYQYGSHAHKSTTSLPGSVQDWFDFNFPVPQLMIPAELAQLHSQRMLSGAELGERWTADKRFSAIDLNDILKFTLKEIGDCFELTFLPGDWEARNAQVTSG